MRTEIYVYGIKCSELKELNLWWYGKKIKIYIYIYWKIFKMQVIVSDVSCRRAVSTKSRNAVTCRKIKSGKPPPEDEYRHRSSGPTPRYLFSYCLTYLYIIIRITFHLYQRTPAHRLKWHFNALILLDWNLLVKRNM